jgi:hypothetical protein
LLVRSASNPVAERNGNWWQPRQQFRDSSGRFRVSVAIEETYSQRLDAIGLTIERATDRTPDTRQFHVFYGDELQGSFKKLPEAQKLFRRLKEESGWKPPPKEELTPEEMLVREREAHQRVAHLEYGSSSHMFRGGGRPRRK